MEAGSEAEPQDIDEIVMAYYCNADPNQDELQKVEDAINEISEEQINVHVSLLPLSLGQWDQQINLMVSGNEQLDLMPTFFGGFHHASFHEKFQPAYGNFGIFSTNMVRESLNWYARNTLPQPHGMMKFMLSPFTGILFRTSTLICARTS